LVFLEKKKPGSSVPVGFTSAKSSDFAMLLRAVRSTRGSSARFFSVNIDKSPGQKAKLTGYWTSKLPQELVAAMSQGEGDGDIRTVMRQAASQARLVAASVKSGDDDEAKRVEREAVSATTRGMDR
jgi:hypothetical protein